MSDPFCRKCRQPLDATPLADEMRTLRARVAELERLTSPTPGLAESGPYSAADVDTIEAHRGKPYARLRATVAERDALRAQVTAARGVCGVRPDDCEEVKLFAAEVLRAMDEAKP